MNVTIRHGMTKAHLDSNLARKLACKQLVRGKVMSCKRDKNSLLFEAFSY